MLAKGLFVSLIANVFIVNIIGKTLLIETEDDLDKDNEKEENKKAAVAQGNKQGLIHKTLRKS